MQRGEVNVIESIMLARDSTNIREKNLKYVKPKEKKLKKFACFNNSFRKHHHTFGKSEDENWPN